MSRRGRRAALRAMRAARRSGPVARGILALAKQIDTMLEERLGAIYHWILISSIVGGIGQSLGRLFASPDHGGALNFGVVGAVGLILLIHQVAELGDRLERSRSRR